MRINKQNCPKLSQAVQSCSFFLHFLHRLKEGLNFCCFFREDSIQLFRGQAIASWRGKGKAQNLEPGFDGVDAQVHRLGKTSKQGHQNRRCQVVPAKSEEFKCFTTFAAQSHASPCILGQLIQVFLGKVTVPIEDVHDIRILSSKVQQELHAGEQLQHDQSTAVIPRRPKRVLMKEKPQITSKTNIRLDELRVHC